MKISHKKDTKVITVLFPLKGTLNFTHKVPEKWNMECMKLEPVLLNYIL